jgi:hypothetical protein
MHPRNTVEWRICGPWLDFLILKGVCGAPSVVTVTRTQKGNGGRGGRGSGRVVAYRWLVDASGGGIAPEHVVVGGCSAGGGLAVALLLAIRDAGLQQPAAALSLSPWVDLTQSGQSYHSNHGKCFITKGYLDWCAVSPSRCHL